ncbi:lipoprotein [Virgibacillus oceani]|uniref:DUF4352 domain-containing protein n=1 Tax=Virgibacillus oceani TaxID=1479511 RepID=A0A917GZT3_9BACI|nr:membrane lipoprotein lipid attachment site-containing protein [Virgibacillus oceani]GGG62964.1 hypothetical protein GCM10011398_02940 [Virgibacillus oceani]
MKKILFLLLAISLVAGCSSNSKDNDSKNEEEQASKPETQEVAVHKIEDTVKVKSHDFGFSYEVTLNSYDEKKEYNGKTVKDLVEGESLTGDSFAVANVTIKNTSDQTFVPMEKLEPVFDISVPIGIYKELSPKLNNSLKPGDEITVDLVSGSGNNKNNIYLVFEYMKDEEARFLLNKVDG